MKLAIWSRGMGDHPAKSYVLRVLSVGVYSNASCQSAWG